MLCYVMLPHFMCKIWCSKRVKSYALLCCVMICYANLFYEQNPMLSMSKILWSVMLCLWWHELKSKILWCVMLVLFVSPFTGHLGIQTPFPTQTSQEWIKWSSVPSISLVDEYAFKAWAPLYIIWLEVFKVWATFDMWWDCKEEDSIT